MIHHPIILGTKAIILFIIIIVLVILHGVLPPEQFTMAVYIGAGVFLLSIVVVWGVFFRLLSNPDSKLSRQMVLQDTPRDKTEQQQVQNRLASLTGTVGSAETNLRPSGIGKFGDQLIDVIAERSFIEKDQKITIASVEGKKVWVKKA